MKALFIASRKNMTLRISVGLNIQPDSERYVCLAKNFQHDPDSRV